MQYLALWTWCPVLVCVLLGARWLPAERRSLFSWMAAGFWLSAMVASHRHGGLDTAFLWALVVGASAMAMIGSWCSSYVNSDTTDPSPQELQDRYSVKKERVHRLAPLDGDQGRRADDRDARATVEPNISEHMMRDDRTRDAFEFRGNPGDASHSNVTLLHRDRLETSESEFAGCAADVMEQFDEWLSRAVPLTAASAERAESRHVGSQDWCGTRTWPAFAEFVRSTLFQLCQGSHVNVIRVDSVGGGLESLDRQGVSRASSLPDPRQGIVGYVMTSGHSYVAGDRDQGQLVANLASESQDPCAWCFPVNHGGHRIGLVHVGQLMDAHARDRRILRCIEQIVSQMWLTLEARLDACGRATCDPASGLLNRETFLAAAAESLADSYSQNEPVAVAVIAIEGLRRLDDQGAWTQSQDFIRQAAGALVQRVRSDDVLGRFDDARFVLLLRRVDSALARMILQKIVDTLMTLQPQRAGVSAEGSIPSEFIEVRCGLAGSGTDQPPFTSLMSRAIQQCHEARRSQVLMTADLPRRGGQSSSNSESRHAGKHGPSRPTEHPGTPGLEVLAAIEGSDHAD